MSDKTGIEWTDSTFNPWIGCTKVGPGCDHCYAETLMDKRHHRVQWGAGNARSRTSEANWKMPLAWNAKPFFECRACRHRFTFKPEWKEGIVHCPACKSELTKLARRRVFCASLADVFDNAVDPQWRLDLYALIRATPNLDWLLLTKRIGNVNAWGLPVGADHAVLPNLWIGATVVNQEEADRDIPKLLAVPAAVRFLSIEPMLGPITVFDLDGPIDVPTGMRSPVHWIIAGGESGPQARPAHPDWFRSLRDQCAAASVPFLFKQWGEYVSVSEVAVEGAHHQFADGATVRRIGKKPAGRLLDGVQHDGFPATSADR